MTRAQLVGIDGNGVLVVDVERVLENSGRTLTRRTRPVDVRVQRKVLAPVSLKKFIFSIPLALSIKILLTHFNLCFYLNIFPNILSVIHIKLNINYFNTSKTSNA